MTANTDTGQWLPIESAPYGVPVWGFRLDPGSPWAYGVLSLVERHQEEGADGWCLREDGEEIDPPVLWAPAQIPLRPKLWLAAEPLSDALDEHPSPSPDLEAMARAYEALRLGIPADTLTVHPWRIAAIRAAWSASPGPSLQAEVERLRAALDLAATRLLACGVYLAASKYKEALDADDWSRAARSALNPTLTNEEKGSG